MWRLDEELDDRVRSDTPDCGFPINGRAPYGYRLDEHTDHKAIAPDPLTAPVVRRIFEEYANGSGLQVIAERLTAEGVLCPSAYDARRNPKHSGSAWSKVAVRAIITNDRYVMQHAGPAAGPLRCGQCRARHGTAALVPPDVYRRTRDILARRAGLLDTGRCPTEETGRYRLRGVLRCALCQRLMQGTWNNRVAYYRCRFPKEYARANNIDHPANVYAREDRLVLPLHEWICRSLPAQLSQWLRGQQPGVRMRLANRTKSLGSLLGYAARHPAGSIDVYSPLAMRLVYEPLDNLLEVSCEPLPGAVIRGAVAL